MKLYVSSQHGAVADAAVLVVAELAGHKLETVVVTDEIRKTPDFKAKDILGKLPILETDDGCLQETTAICTYLAALSGKFLGNSDVEKAHVDQWINFTNTALIPSALDVMKGIFGSAPINQGEWNDAVKHLKAHCKTLNTALDKKKWLATNDASVADIIVAMCLLRPLQTVLDAGFRKAMKNLTTWVAAVFELPCVKKVCGRIHLADKALKPVVAAEKKEEKKKAAPAPAKKEPKAEKPKDNVESLPPTTFDVYDFKTLYVNH